MCTFWGTPCVYIYIKSWVILYSSFSHVAYAMHLEILSYLQKKSIIRSLSLFWDTIIFLLELFSSLFRGLHTSIFTAIQSILNKATSIILQKCNSYHIISMLKFFPVSSVLILLRIKTKVLLMAARSPQDLASPLPFWISILLTPDPSPYHTSETLESMSMHQLSSLSGMLFPHFAIFSPLLRHCSSLIITTNYPILPFYFHIPDLPFSLLFYSFFFSPWHISHSNTLFNLIIMLITYF